jgi:hypothetical protein
MAIAPQSTDAPTRQSDEESSPPKARALPASVTFGLLVALTLLPLAATLVSIARRGWHPAGDIALETLRIGDVGGRHTPLVGVYSRFGWSHPGPALFWVLAPFRWLLGNTGVLLGVGIINAAAIAGALVLARRRGGLTLALLTGVVVLLLVEGLGSDLLVNPWNPWVPVLPFLTYLFLAWSVAQRDFNTLPWLVGVGSFAMQVHIGYAPLVIGLGVVAVALALFSRAGTPATGSASRAALIATVVGVVLWLPPLVQQVTGHPGNLGDIISYFRHPAVAAAGWRTGFGMMGEELGPHLPWIAGHDTISLGTVATSSTIPALALLVASTALAVVAARRGTRSAFVLAVLVDVATALGVVAGSRVEGLVSPYLVRWWWVIAAGVWLSIGWSLLSLSAHTRVATVAVAVVTAAAVVLGIVDTVNAVPVRAPDQAWSTVLGHLAPAARRKLSRHRIYLVRWVGGRDWGAVGTGLFVDLDDRGFDVRVPRAVSHGFGSWRAVTPPYSSVTDAVTVVAIADENEVWTAPRDAVLLARYDTLTPRERGRKRVLEREVRAALRPRVRMLPLPPDNAWGRRWLIHGGAPANAVNEFEALERRDNGYSVYLMPASS